MVDLLIPGPEGKIEAKYSHNNRDDSPIVILLHPDPSKGGTMHTKIIFKMYRQVFIMCYTLSYERTRDTEQV